MAVAQLAPIAKDFKIADVPVSIVGLVLPALTFALAIDRVLNGICRPFFGWLSDQIGRELTMLDERGRSPDGLVRVAADASRADGSRGLTQGTLRRPRLGMPPLPSHMPAHAGMFFLARHRGSWRETQRPCSGICAEHKPSLFALLPSKVLIFSLRRLRMTLMQPIEQEVLETNGYHHSTNEG